MNKLDFSAGNLDLFNKFKKSKIQHCHLRVEKGVIRFDANPNRTQPSIRAVIQCMQHLVTTNPLTKKQSAIIELALKNIEDKKESSFLERIVARIFRFKTDRELITDLYRTIENKNQEREEEEHHQKWERRLRESTEQLEASLRKREIELHAAEERRLKEVARFTEAYGNLDDLVHSSCFSSLGTFKEMYNAVLKEILKEMKKEFPEEFFYAEDITLSEEIQLFRLKRQFDDQCRSCVAAKVPVFKFFSQVYSAAQSELVRSCLADYIFHWVSINEGLCSFTKQTTSTEINFRAYCLQIQIRLFPDSRDDLLRSYVQEIVEMDPKGLTETPSQLDERFEKVLSSYLQHLSSQQRANLKEYLRQAIQCQDQQNSFLLGDFLTGCQELFNPQIKPAEVNQILEQIQIVSQAQIEFQKGLWKTLGFSVMDCGLFTVSRLPNHFAKLFLEKGDKKKFFNTMLFLLAGQKAFSGVPESLFTSLTKFLNHKYLKDGIKARRVVLGLQALSNLSKFSSLRKFSDIFSSEESLSLYHALLKKIFSDPHPTHIYDNLVLLQFLIPETGCIVLRDLRALFDPWLTGKSTLREAIALEFDRYFNKDMDVEKIKAAFPHLLIPLLSYAKALDNHYGLEKEELGSDEAAQVKENFRTFMASLARKGGFVAWRWGKKSLHLEQVTQKLSSEGCKALTTTSQKALNKNYQVGVITGCSDEEANLFFNVGKNLGSCQSYDTNFNTSKSLLGYMDPKCLIAGVWDPTEKCWISRAVLKVLLEKGTDKPILFMERFYGAAHYSKEVEAAALAKAREIGIPLYVKSDRGQKHVIHTTLESRSGGPLEYVDANHEMNEGVYDITPPEGFREIT